MLPETAENANAWAGIAPIKAEPWLARDPAKPFYHHSGLPIVPALARSRLRLELTLRQPALDLRAISDLVRSDLGLTIQVLRLVGADFSQFDEPPWRITDSIVHLGRSALLAAASALDQSSRCVSQAALAGFWIHSRQVACWAEDFARRLGGVDAEKAYMAGLLHDIGSLPGLLRWHCPGIDLADRPVLGCALATLWRLPGFILQSIRYQATPEKASPLLPRLVVAAHARAGAIVRCQH